MASQLEEAARAYVQARVFPGEGAAATRKAELALVEAVMETQEAAERKAEIRDLARSFNSGDDSPSIDDDAIVSEGDDSGAYVHAWVWVPFSGTKLAKVCDDCDQAIPIGEASVDGLCGACHQNYKCTRCGADTAGGEGWNGLCGNCADKEESMHGTQAQP